MKSQVNTIILIFGICLTPLSQSYAAESLFNRAVGLFSGKDDSSVPAGIDSSEIAQAFKQALSIGSERVISQLGAKDGFNSDPAIHIPPPSFIQKARSILAITGLSDTVDDLELRLNRAAEAATPVAKSLFLDSITKMNFNDVMEIYNGANDSATHYFKNAMSDTLSLQMRPIVEENLQEVGALSVLDEITARYQPLKMIPDLRENLTGYVVEKGMDGIFYYLALQEAAIRENPIQQTTELLKRVFGKQ